MRARLVGFGGRSCHTVREMPASSQPGEWVLDLFAGSGTLGAAAVKTGCRVVCVDSSAQAIDVMQRRLGAYAEIRRR